MYNSTARCDNKISPLDGTLTSEKAGGLAFTPQTQTDGGLDGGANENIREYPWQSHIEERTNFKQRLMLN